MSGPTLKGSAAGIAVLSFAALLAAQNTALDKSRQTLQDKNKQTLNLAKDPPLVAIGETSKLVFHVSPLSSTGPLSQQLRDALKAILKLNGNSVIVHIRALAAGSGDVRRIPQIVSDVLTEKHMPLPSVSVVQAGALPLNDSDIVLETISAGKKDVNKDGLTFYAAESVVATEPTMELKPLLEKSLDQLAAKMKGRAALAVTCFVSSLDGAQELTGMVKARFAGAAINLVQPRRLAWQTEASCEGVSQGAAIKTLRIAFSGTQVAFGNEEKDGAVALQRLDRALNGVGAPGTNDAALLRFYVPSARKIPVKVNAPVASFAVEGVGPVEAGFALDAVAPVVQ
jgi:hypothetical protein